LKDLLNKLKYKIDIYLIIFIGLLALILLFYINYSAIVSSLFFIEGMWILSFFILFRIAITAVMALIAFKTLFKQEKIHFMDISFLFGLFFLGLTIGKALDLLYKLIFFTSENLTKLKLLKIRYILIILTSAPLILIGLNLIMFIKVKQYEDIKTFKNRTILSIIILLLIVCIQTFLVLFAKDITQLRLMLICIHTPSLIWILFTFIYAKKSQKIPQINSVIIGVAFLMDLILYIGSTVIMPIKQTSNRFSIMYSVLAELFDLIVIIVIFIGYYNINLKDKFFFKNKGERN